MLAIIRAIIANVRSRSYRIAMAPGGGPTDRRKVLSVTGPTIWGYIIGSMPGVRLDCRFNGADWTSAVVTRPSQIVEEDLARPLPETKIETLVAHQDLGVQKAMKLKSNGGNDYVLLYNSGSVYCDQQGPKGDMSCEAASLLEGGQEARPQTSQTQRRPIALEQDGLAPVLQHSRLLRRLAA